MEAPQVATTVTSESLYDSHMAALRSAHAQRAAAIASAAMSRGTSFVTPQRLGGAARGSIARAGASNSGAPGALESRRGGPNTGGPHHLTAPRARSENAPAPAYPHTSHPSTEGFAVTAAPQDGEEGVREGGFYSPVSTPRHHSSDGPVSPLSMPDHDSGDGDGVQLGDVPFSFSPRLAGDLSSVRPVASVARPAAQRERGRAVRRPGGLGHPSGPVKAVHPSAGSIRTGDHQPTLPPPPPPSIATGRRSASASRSRSVADRTERRGGAAGGDDARAAPAPAAPARTVSVAQARRKASLTAPSFLHSSPPHAHAP
jgi:hypothetical protein